MSQFNTTDMATFTQTSRTLSESAALNVTTTDFDLTITVPDVTYICGGITGIIGNSLVILAIILSRKLRSTLHWFILNLACADALTSLLFMSTAVIHFPSVNVLTYLKIMRFVRNPVFWYLVGVSVSTHALIAFTSWYLITKNPAKKIRLFRTRNTCFMVALTWILPLIIPILNILTRVTNTISNSTDYFIIVIVTWIFGHFVAIVSAYTAIWRFVAHQGTIMKKTKNLKNQSQKGISIDKLSSDKACANEGGNPEDDRNDFQTSHSLEQVASSEYEQISQTTLEISVHASKCRTRRDSKRHLDPKLITLTKHLVVVLFAFFMCFIPFVIILCLKLGHREVPVRVADWFLVLLFFSNCINPIIYARRIREFREVMWCIIRCQLRSIAMPIECLRRMTHRD